jgi:hypothetical protein
MEIEPLKRANLPYITKKEARRFSGGKKPSY